MNEKYPIIKFGAFTYMHKIKKIIFRDNIPILLNNVIDFSEAQDMSVVGWHNPHDLNKTVLHIAPMHGNKVIANKNSSYMFQSCANLKYIFGLYDLDTSQVTDMSGMFSGCKRLFGLDLSKFDMSNVVKARIMFSGCSSLKHLDLTASNMDNLEDADFMFGYCRMLSTLRLPLMPNVKNMKGLFYQCESLVHLKANINLRKVDNMDDALTGCPNLMLSINS